MLPTYLETLALKIVVTPLIAMFIWQLVQKHRPGDPHASYGWCLVAAAITISAPLLAWGIGALPWPHAVSPTLVRLIAIPACEFGVTALTSYILFGGCPAFAFAAGLCAGPTLLAAHILPHPFKHPSLSIWVGVIALVGQAIGITIALHGEAQTRRMYEASQRGR